MLFPYYALSDAGADVTPASPGGGIKPVDPTVLGPKVGILERFLADKILQAHMVDTYQTSEFDGARFDAVFFPGGHGTMWDLPFDTEVTSVVERAFEAIKFIVPVCHGAKGLVTEKRADGKPIVGGMRVISFTDSEEIAVGLEWCCHSC